MDSEYDTIGINYSELRKPDPRIRDAIEKALGSAESVLNVGAGAGSYEPDGRQVTAVEPSIEMIRQRRGANARVVQGRAEDLPFPDKSFDATMAVLTVHHWADQAKGIAEMRRVTRGPVVILTYDPAFRGFWLADYIPELVELDEAQMPRMSDYEEWLGPVEASPVPIPHDCTDGFLCAYWRRPAAYLDPRVRAAMSTFWKLGDVSAALARLGQDLESGAWTRRYGRLLDLAECDCGYRLVVAKQDRGPERPFGEFDIQARRTSMQDGSERPDSERESGEGNSRPQRAGEAATTRFGMEEGDNTDVPATGGVTSDEDGSERSG